MKVSEVTMQSFARQHGITLQAEWADENKNAPDWTDANHYKVILKHNRRQLTTYFSQGYGISGAPEVQDVLDCLASDAAGYEGARSFEEWCGDYGYDTDSRKAEQTYKTVGR